MLPAPKIELPLKPKNKSIARIPGTKYFAFIGIGINSKDSSAFGTINANATKSP